MLLALALVLFAAVPLSARAAAPVPNPTPTAATAATAAPSRAIPCLIVATSGCPLAPGSAPIPVQVPGAVDVVGANWTPGATVRVWLTPAAQTCASAPAAGAQVQAQVSTAGVFGVALPLPASAPNDALYAVCAATADSKQAFPDAGAATQSPLRIRVMRATPAAASAPASPIDGFSLAALALAALSAGAFTLSWLRGRRTEVSANR